MPSHSSRYHMFLLSLLLALLPWRFVQGQQTLDVVHAENWKEQGIEQVMQPWLRHAIDSVDGQFHAYLNRQWQSAREGRKYPGMLARHLFSLSAAFMMSGNRDYIQRAGALFNYLQKYGWDAQHGGWYYAINRQGRATVKKKDLFMNIYAATGLALYYAVTHNKQARALIDRTHALMEQHAWDEHGGGYFKTLSREWKVADSSKVFTPQVAPLSGYLHYMYLATRDEHYLDHSLQLMKLTAAQLQDPSTGWIREYFRGNTTAQPANSEQFNVGHNIEVAWMGMRLYTLTATEIFKEDAFDLTDRLLKYTFTSNGAWVHKGELQNPRRHPSDSPWWIQAYGNMMQLYAYYLTGRANYLENFKKGAAFWNEAFVDARYGGAVLTASLDGAIARGDKAVRTKTSYHAMEHSLLNYLYLKLWVEKEPAALYFYLSSASDGRPLCPAPVASGEITIGPVLASGRSVSVRRTSEGRCLQLQEDVQHQILKVTIR